MIEQTEIFLRRLSSRNVIDSSWFARKQVSNVEYFLNGNLALVGVAIKGVSRKEMADPYLGWDGTRTRRRNETKHNEEQLLQVGWF